MTHSHSANADAPAQLTTRSVQDRNFFDLRKQGSVGWQSTPSHFMVQLPGQDSSIMFSYRDIGNHWMLKPAAGRSCSTWVWVEAELSNVASGERVLCLQANDHGSFKASIIGYAVRLVTAHLCMCPIPFGKGIPARPAALHGKTMQE